MVDNLFDEVRIRAFTIIDNISRECMVIHVDNGVNLFQMCWVNGLMRIKWLWAFEARKTNG